ncbi:hypothetical protein NUW58_g3882 [Xylaria curta]|uniref:Uncharacterized protein n=1 Tax=Xylaria curta TaxID=42375 RepID=A0ACC1PA29_9PEZI|nr:hypothetical protein NUW58_g3882 [Xylaria curta]
MSSANKVLELALAKFRGEQPPDLFGKFQQTQLRDLQKQILSIQASQDHRKSMVDFPRIRSFITAFEAFAETFPLTSEQAACIWGPVVKDDIKAIDEILQSYRELGTRIPSTKPYASLVTEKPEVSICLAFMYQDLLQFQECLLKLFAGHDWKLTFHTSWKYYHGGSFRALLDSFDHHRKTLEDILRAHHYQKTIDHHQISSDMHRQFNNYLQGYQDDRQYIETHILRYEEDRKVLLDNAKKQEAERKEKMFEQFSRTRKEYPGTTDWIVKNDNVENWMHEENSTTSILFITGKKGAGKTILASRIIDHCIEHHTSFKASFFYCREDDPNQNNCLSVYKSLLIQMLVNHRELLPACDEKRLKGNEILNDDAPAQALIRLFCNADMNQFIIIDGVDEIEPAQRKPLLKFFADIVDKCDGYKPGKVRVLFLSHDLPDYKNLKCLESATFMQLDPNTTQKDIEMFVSKKAEELKQELGLEDQDLQHIKKLTVARSDGMFLFASLAMENLLMQPTVEDVIRELRPEVFPNDLHKAYCNIIDRLYRNLGPNQWLMAKKIFGWLACAKRPLNWHEIQAALSMVIDKNDASVSFHYYNKSLRHDIRKICGSLVQRLGNRIMFVHSTAKLYIVGTDHLNTEIIECDFTTTCLRYLCSPLFRSDLTDVQREGSTREGCYSFQDYALAKWGHHLDAVIKAGPGLPPDYLADLSQAMSQFVQVYGNELSILEDAEEKILRAKEECRAFSNYNFFETLVKIWAHLSHQQRAHIKERNKLSLPSLAASLKKNRATIESLSDQKQLGELYGDYVFKCDRLTCDYFYEGFSDKAARDNHLRRHDRPFHCPVPGCLTSKIGFLTSKDLAKHSREVHSDDASAPTFIQLPRELVEDARFSCPDCGKNFTRKANRDAHSRHGTTVLVHEMTTPLDHCLNEMTDSMRPTWNEDKETKFDTYTRCERVDFQPLLGHDRESGFYILHHSQVSYSRSLAGRCALCTLISSQLGRSKLEDNVCNQLSAFMVLKRRWPSASNTITSVKIPPVAIHSQLGFGTLAVIDALPKKYQVPGSVKTGRLNRKRKRGQSEATGPSKAAGNEQDDDSEETPSHQILFHHTGSHENMTLAGHWIKDCIGNHDMCASGSSRPKASFAPTRLVDAQDPTRPFLRTADNTGKEYIALSYVWGNGERFVTSRANFKDHQDRIPPESAPNTFIDALQVTRELGYRYIWIDALCIIQDDGDDLEHELSNMGNIYRHAAFTVFAEGAPDVSAGLFQQRDPHLYRPCTVGVTMATKEGVVSENLTLGTIVTGPNYLKGRGWVLQEEVLSSRCLYFGKQISWQCVVSEASEARPAPRPRKTPLSHGRETPEDKLTLWLYAPEKMGDASRDIRWNQYDAWYSVMEEYSVKNLSVATDHLRALSGLADLFQRAHQATYVAGLWREDLKLGLTWYVAINDTRPVSEAGIQKPSWSWVSVGMVRLKFRSWRAFSTHEISESAEILDASCTPIHQSNPTGNVLGGSLRLRTRVKKLRLRWSEAYAKNRTEFSYGSYSGTEANTMTRGEHPRFPARIFNPESNHFVGEAALDRPMRTRPETGAGDMEVWCALLHAQKTSNSLQFTAIVLESTTDPTGYNRLGLLFSNDQHAKDLSFSDWDMKQIDIL